MSGYTQPDRTGGQVIGHTRWLPSPRQDLARLQSRGVHLTPPRGARRRSGCRVRDIQSVVRWGERTGIKKKGRHKPALNGHRMLE
jgi:hypothetical protein